MVEVPKIIIKVKTICIILLPIINKNVETIILFFSTLLDFEKFSNDIVVSALIYNENII